MQLGRLNRYLLKRGLVVKGLTIIKYKTTVLEIKRFSSCTKIKNIRCINKFCVHKKFCSFNWLVIVHIHTGMCEVVWEPEMGPDDLFESISQALLNAQDRDCLAGWGAVVHIM